jgi:transposase
MINKLDKLLIDCISQNALKSKYAKHFDFSFDTQTYEIRDMVAHVFFISKTGNSWGTLDNINLIGYNPVKSGNAHKFFQKLVRFNLFELTYIELLRKYIKKTPARKLKVQSTDTTFIRNKYGVEDVGRNKLMKGKKTTKISEITDSNGVAINIFITAGNHNDTNIIQKHLDSMLIDHDINDKYKKYFLGDKGYCSNNLRDMLSERNYIPIIDYNNRKTKNPEKMRYLNNDELNVYKQRIIIEHTFGKIKRNNRRIDTRYEKKLCNYKGFVFMGHILHLLHINEKMKTN